MSDQVLGGVNISLRAYGAVAAQIVAAVREDEGPCMEGRRKDRMPTSAIRDQGFEVQVSLDADTVAGLTVACMLADQAEVGLTRPAGVCGVLHSIARSVVAGVFEGMTDAKTATTQPAAAPVDTEPVYRGDPPPVHAEPDSPADDGNAPTAATEPDTPTNGTGAVKEVAIEVKEGGTTASFVATKAGSSEPPAQPGPAPSRSRHASPAGIKVAIGGPSAELGDGNPPPNGGMPV